jgi:hypothetical protein
MDWIFDNLQILVFIAAGIAYSLNSMRQAKAEAAAERERQQNPVDLEEIFGPDFDFNEPPHRQPQSEVFLPPPVSGTPQPAEAPVASARERREFPQAGPSPQRPQSPHQQPSQDTLNAELERQRSLEQRILSLRQNRESRKSGAAATQRSVVAKRAASRGGIPDVEPIALDGIRSRLRSSREARRAIVLREILDTPVGLR